MVVNFKYCGRVFKIKTHTVYCLNHMFQFHINNTISFTTLNYKPTKLKKMKTKLFLIATMLVSVSSLFAQSIDGKE